MDLMISIPSASQTPAGLAATPTAGAGEAVAGDLLVGATTAIAADPSKSPVPFAELLAMMALGLHGQALQETASDPSPGAGEALTDPEAESELPSTVLPETVPLAPSPTIVATTVPPHAVTSPIVADATSDGAETPGPVAGAASQMTAVTVATAPTKLPQPTTPVAASAISSQSPPDVANGGIADALSRSDVASAESAAAPSPAAVADTEISPGGLPGTAAAMTLKDPLSESETQATDQTRPLIAQGDDESVPLHRSQPENEDNLVRSDDRQPRLPQSSDQESDRSGRSLDQPPERSNQASGINAGTSLPDLEIAELEGESRTETDTAVKATVTSPTGRDQQMTDDVNDHRRPAPERIVGADPAMSRPAPASSAAVAPLVPAGPAPSEAPPTIIARPEALPQTIMGELEDMVQRQSFRRIVIRLDPPDLGEVVVELRHTKDDVSVVIRAENTDAARALSRQEGDVQRAVQGLGLELGQFDVGTENGNDARQRPGRANRANNPETFATELAEDSPEATREGVLLL